jgi:hypothetical protein
MHRICLPKYVIEGKTEEMVMMKRKDVRCYWMTLSERKNTGNETGSTRLNSLENSLWNRLWACRRLWTLLNEWN